MVVTQNGGGGDGGIGEVPLVQPKLGEGAEHPLGLDSPQVAPGDVDAAGEPGVILGHRHQVAHMDVPCPGDDLHRLVLAHVHLAHPHMVGIGVALPLLDAAHHHIGDLGPQVGGGLHLGAGEGHGFCKLFVIGVNGDELAEPFSG